MTNGDGAGNVGNEEMWCVVDEIGMFDGGIVGGVRVVGMGDRLTINNKFVHG